VVIAVLVLGILIGFWLLPAVWMHARRARERRRAENDAVSPEERALAEERSSALLRELLEEHEYQQLLRHGYVDVASPSRATRVYRIPCFAGRVRIYEDGRPLAELCVQPVVALPTNDVIVLHKLMIEANEQGYLARANQIPLVLPPRYYE
jgi:hypothetical protein